MVAQNVPTPDPAEVLRSVMLSLADTLETTVRLLRESAELQVVRPTAEPNDAEGEPGD